MLQNAKQCALSLAKEQTGSCSLKLGNICSYISLVSEFKILDITISSDLICNAQAKTHQSITKMIVVLNRFSSLHNTDVHRRLLNAFIFPNISYCQPVRCHVGKSKGQAMDNVLLRSARVVLHDKAAGRLIAQQEFCHSTYCRQVNA